MPIRRAGSPVYYTNFVLNGTRVRRSTGTTDRTLAEQIEAKLKRDLWMQARLGERPTRSWKEAVVQYEIAKHGKHTLGQDIDRLLKLTPGLESIPLDRIDTAAVNAAIRRYETTALAENKRGWRTNRAMTPAARNRYRSVVQHLLNLAESEWGWIAHAPKLRREPETHDEARWLTPDEAQRLLAACTGLRAHWHAPIALALATGLRAGHIFGLQWEWIDLQRRIIVVPARIARKRRRTMPIPLNDFAVSILRQQATRTGAVFLHRGKAFPRINPGRFASLCEALGIEGATFHSLRHTWAAWHIMAGTPLYDLMVMGGWTSLAMLQSTYGHLSVEHLAESAQRIVGTNLVTVATQPVTELPVTT